ncbi:hypothetical protein DNTS_014279 [Danionella cerebrum]|uniref:RGS domain-containing protein n=1 Tax=Danionella cerebrum TaxID=2873325 RepID=A0A553R424_9TELE|nr:hypothetical protein DNTS_014279 [Danionella translucida]
MDRVTKMKNASSDSSIERLIIKGEESPEQSQKRKTNWRSRMFKNFSSRESRHSSGLSTEEVSQWAQSLDHLLSSKYGLMALQLFMQSEHSEENLEFWLACEDYRQIDSLPKLKSKATAIYEQFIRPDSPKEINLDTQTRKALGQSIRTPTQSIFSAAQSRVYFLMENNSYPRFLESHLYQHLSGISKAEP